MRFQNFTPVPNEELREIIRFCCPPNVTRFDIAFKNSSRGFRAWAYYNGTPHHERSLIRRGLREPNVCQRYTPLVTISIPPIGDVTYPSFHVGHGGYLPSVQFTQQEDIVHLVAHELRHLWQNKIKRGYRVWGSRGQFSERDADAYAIQMVRQWRRRVIAVSK